MTFYVHTEFNESVGFPSFSEAAKYVLDESFGPRGYILKWPDKEVQNVLFYTGLFNDKLVKIIGIFRDSEDIRILQEIQRATGNEYDPNKDSCFRYLTLVQQTGYGSFTMRPYKEGDLGFIAFGGNF